MRLPSLTMGWQTTLGLPIKVRCLSMKIKKLERNSIFATFINMVSATSLCTGAKAVDQDHITLCVAAKQNYDLYSMELQIKCKERDN